MAAWHERHSSGHQTGVVADATSEPPRHGCPCAANRSAGSAQTIQLSQQHAMALGSSFSAIQELLAQTLHFFQEFVLFQAQLSSCHSCLLFRSTTALGLKLRITQAFL